jgi:hypothetical protein
MVELRVNRCRDLDITMCYAAPLDAEPDLDCVFVSEQATRRLTVLLARVG